MMLGLDPGSGLPLSSGHLLYHELQMNLSSIYTIGSSEGSATGSLFERNSIFGIGFL
jgi:hypothetical protein